MTDRRKICNLFNTPRGCRFGSRCKFEHVANPGKLTSSPHSSSYNKTPSTAERDLRQWTYAVPLDEAVILPLGPELPGFLRQAQQLLDKDAVIRKAVISHLASDGGLHRIKEVFQAELHTLGPRARAQLLCEQHLVLMEIMTHPGVLNYPSVEQMLGSIFLYVYGVGGTRLLPFAASLTTFLSDILQDASLVRGRSVAAVLATSLCWFRKAIEVHGNAKIHPDTLTIADNLLAIVDQAAENIDARTLQLCRVQLTHIHNRVQSGKHIPEYGADGSARPNATGWQTTPIGNGPGTLSSQGPRHDNDHVDISDITILPTMDEIKSSRPEYLPTKYSAQWHKQGIQGLLDRNFRLLREDTIGQLRDVIHGDLQMHDQVEGATHNSRKDDGIRSFVYESLAISDISFDSFKGLAFEVRIPQPSHLREAPPGAFSRQSGTPSSNARKEWWENSKRLQSDALVALLDKCNTVLFCTVRQPDDPRQIGRSQRNPEPPREQDANTLFSDPAFAYVQLQLVEDDSKSQRVLLETLLFASPLRLIEFPGVLLASFAPTLEALQKMSVEEDVPFADFLAHTANSKPGSTTIRPPLYSTSRGFSFEMRSATQQSKALQLSPSERFDVNSFERLSTLDPTQCRSVVNTLTQGLALIQGPPGTGKSYTGVSLIKILLDSKSKGDLGPIICVCYTNHALDQLLEHLVDSGIEKIVRIGSRSKSEKIQGCNLRDIARGYANRDETRATYSLHKSKEEISKEAAILIEELRRAEHWPIIKDFLARCHDDHHNQLFGRVEDRDGFKLVNRKPQQLVQSWLQQGDQTNDPPRRLADLFDSPLAEMSRHERRILYNDWIATIRHQATRKMMRVLDDHKVHRRDLDQVRLDTDLRCLGDSNVVGLTTSGLARNINLLRRLPAKVMLCEEAGEVLEAHTLTALLPSIEHAIFIGDHQQLRPSIQRYEFSRDSERGQIYSFDTSMFERLVYPHDTSSIRLPFSTLQTQRRMHPQISRLVRDTLYPDLQDDPSVAEYPPIAGIKPRLFWIDHKHPESGQDEVDGSQSTSRSNDFEVEMTAALVSHLVKQGTYQAKDIAVITPYLGQLSRLRRRLGQMWEVLLDDRDLVQLAASELDQGVGALSLDATVSKAAPNSNVSKSSALSALKVATVDNFQGEEAKIVIVSLVRSNKKHNCGFLKTSNRINVLLSRAQHGMYLIGNSETYENAGVDMWLKVLQMLQDEEKIGTQLELECPRHPDTPLLASCPEDFTKLAPEGGCNRMCQDRLDCGHACINRCHSAMLHSAVKCLEPCPRPLSGCDHSCPKPCGDACPDRCVVNVYKAGRILSCGHPQPNLPCWQDQDPDLAQCRREVEIKIPACGHTAKVSCYLAQEPSKIRCASTCGASRECGHICQKPCCNCTRIVNGSVQKDHGKCLQVCGRDYNTCGHSCKQMCHGDEACELCNAPCEASCVHSTCRKRCHEPCAPCASTSCNSCCPHSKCELPCAAPCNWIPCSRRCTKLLTCGHQCPSVCGEDCPTANFCQTCGSETVKRMQVDYIEMLTFGEINLDQDPCIFPRCGHVMTMANMDGQMDMGKQYELSAGDKPVQVKPVVHFMEDSKFPGCPQCRGSLRNIARYGRIVRRALLDESTKKFIIWSKRQHVDLYQLVQDAQLSLSWSAPPDRSVRLADPTKLDFSGDTTQQVRALRQTLSNIGLEGHYNKLLSLLFRLQSHRLKVKKDEQPFHKVWSLCEDVRRREGKSNTFHFAPEALQTGEHIRAFLLMMRCHRTLVADVLARLIDRPTQYLDVDVTIDMKVLRKECLELVREATGAQKWACVVDAHVSFAHYAAMERIARAAADGPALRDAAAQHLAHARALCHTYPGSTRGMLPEVDEIAKMLRDAVFYSIVTSEERHAVVAAMAAGFRGTGHWYTCVNGHPFTIGECGGPMEQSVCPECGAPIGGRNHIAAAGVSLARELDGLAP